MSGLVRTLKQKETERETHFLERVDVRTCQNMKTTRGSEGNSLAREGRRRDWSGHRNKIRQQGELTSWRGQTSQLVRTLKQTEVARDSLPGEGRGRDWSEH